MNTSESDHRSCEVTLANKAQKKIWGSKGIRTHDLCDTVGAMLYFVTSQLRRSLSLLFLIRSSLIWSLSYTLHVNTWIEIIKPGKSSTSKQSSIECSSYLLHFCSRGKETARCFPVRRKSQSGQEWSRAFLSMFHVDSPQNPWHAHCCIDLLTTFEYWNYALGLVSLTWIKCINLSTTDFT